MKYVNDNLPVISVLMPVFNGEQFVREAIESVLAQTYTNFEFIIINDGSTDGTEAILREYAAKDSRILLTHQENMGLTKSLNKGLRMARGRFIARQDADDISAPERLEVMLSNIKEADLAASLYTLLIEGKRSVPRACYILRFAPTFLLNFILPRVNLLIHGTYFFRRNEILKIGGYREKFQYSQDYDLYLRVRERYETKIVPRSLYQFRIHPQSVGAQKARTQYSLAMLASAFAYERRNFGYDSYEAFDPEHLNSFINGMAHHYRFFILGAVYTSFLRSGNMARRKEILAELK